MRTKYRHIYFDEVEFKNNHKTWLCRSNDGDDLLGVVGYGAWRQYTFSPYENTEFSHDCLSDIAHFLRQANKEVKR